MIKSCRSVSTVDELKKVRQAFAWINEACKTAPKKMGELTIFHSLEIAKIVAGEIGLGGTSVIAALLSNFIDTDTFSIPQIKENFGPKIAEITEGLYKISKIKSEKTSTQADNLRNLILSLSSDIRVILIKIAERLYIMRKLDRLSQEEQIMIASESSYIYSPIAHRLGLYNVMSEMEDITMKYLEPEPYQQIKARLKATDAKRNKLIREFIKPVEQELEKHRIKAEIISRMKAISSIWKKMKKQKVDFDEVYDKFAIRIIIDSQPKTEKGDCWRVYSIITDLYTPNPLRMRDWISVPKSNGYESLHTTVVVPGGDWVEVQIRSRRMNEIAEKGFAAHWKYKGITGEKGVDEWLEKVRELINNPETDAVNLIDDFKLNLYSKEIFVFTPGGDLKKFPEGSTVLDFAFDIHTAVGTSCIGAKVNGKNVPIRYSLKNGDKVEILRSKNQKPNIDWLNFVATSKAKSKIKLAIKEEKLKDAENGREILRRRFKNWKMEFSDSNVRKLLQRYKYNDAIDLYYDIYTEKIDLLEIKELLTEKDKQPELKNLTTEDISAEKVIKKTIIEPADFLIIDNSMSNVEYRFGKCCNPVQGDNIFGFVTVGSGITIHRLNCPNARQLLSKYGYRIVKAMWRSTEGQKNFLSTIKITGINDIGIISNISDMISKDLNVNVRSITLDSKEGSFESKITVFVSDNNQLEFLIRRLMKVKGVISVKRFETP